LRILQNILLVVGAMSLGTFGAFCAVAFLLGSIQPDRHEEPWTRGFGQALGGLICGAPLGALTGLAASLVWIGARHDRAAWSVVVWLGILLGLLMGPSVSFRLGLHNGFGWWGTALVTAACGTVGGSLAGMALAIGKPATKVR
jgi:hypothetical protein